MALTCEISMAKAMLSIRNNRPNRATNNALLANEIVTLLRYETSISADVKLYTTKRTSEQLSCASTPQQPVSPGHKRLSSTE
jgi:hypothetical protein